MAPARCCHRLLQMLILPESEQPNFTITLYSKRSKVLEKMGWIFFFLPLPLVSFLHATEKEGNILKGNIFHFGGLGCQNYFLK